MQLVSRGSTSTGLLTIRAATSAWGIPSSAVMGVEPFAGTNAPPPPDMMSLLGAAPVADDHEPRVLHLRIGEQRLDLLVRGALSLVDAVADDLLTLPPAMQSLTPLVSHIALVGGKPSLFVVSPERLLEACRAREKAPGPSGST